MPTEQIPISDGAKRILDCVKNELFPILEEIKNILVDIHKYRISFQIYSRKLQLLERRYQETTARFFEIVKKLQTPDILFAGLGGDDMQVMSEYIRFQGAFEKVIAQGMIYIEIIDRTLDSKNKNIQQARTSGISLLAIIISVVAMYMSSLR